MLRRICSSARWLFNHFRDSRRLEAKPRRRHLRNLVPDSLEPRVALSGVGGSLPIAAIVDNIGTAGQPAHADFQFAINQFQDTRAKRVILGVTVEPSPGSTAQPAINGVRSFQGLPTFNLRPSQTQAQGPLFVNVFLPLTTPTQYRSYVEGQNLSTGTFISTYYLSGDTNGDGVVDSTDLGRVRVAYGSRTGASNFNPNADQNGDGVVGAIDLIFTQRNLGARTSIIKITDANSS